MKKILFLIFISNILFGQNQESVRIWGKTEEDQLSTPVRIGVRDDATTDLDTAFEKEIPPFPPVGDYGIFTRVNFFDSNQEAQVYSYIDLIPNRDGQFYYEHNLDVFLDFGRKHTLYWDDFSGLADSAFLSYADDFIKIDMLENNSYFNENENLTQWFWKVKVWYNPSLTNTDINNNSRNDKEYIYPNPAYNKLFLDKFVNVVKFEIFDLNGQLIDEINSNSKSVNIEYLNAGIYFLKVTKNNGNSSYLRFFVIK